MQAVRLPIGGTHEQASSTAARALPRGTQWAITCPVDSLKFNRRALSASASWSSCWRPHQSARRPSRIRPRSNCPEVSRAASRARRPFRRRERPSTPSPGAYSRPDARSSSLILSSAAAPSPRNRRTRALYACHRTAPSRRETPQGQRSLSRPEPLWPIALLSAPLVRASRTGVTHTLNVQLHAGARRVGRLYGLFLGTPRRDRSRIVALFDGVRPVRLTLYKKVCHGPLLPRCARSKDPDPTRHPLSASVTSRNSRLAPMFSGVVFAPLMPPPHGRVTMAGSRSLASKTAAGVPYIWRKRPVLLKR